MLLVALGCGRLPAMIELAAKRPFVVFGTMEETAFIELAACGKDCDTHPLQVYFYETG